MKKDQDANKRYYFKKLESSQVFEIISRVVPEDAEVYLWCKGQTKEKMEHFLIVGVMGKTLSIRTQGFLAKLARSPNENREVLFKICLGKKQFFSNSLLYIGNDGNYSLDMNGDVYEGLQRRDYRLKASTRTKIKIEIDEEFYDCRDVSAGGTSLILNEQKAKPFNKGAIFENCTLTLNNVKYSILEINVVGRWNVVEEDEPKVKVGIVFSEMKEKIDEKLCLHINSEAREDEILKQLAAKRKSR